MFHADVNAAIAPNVSTVVFAYNKYYLGSKSLGPTSEWEIMWRESAKSVFGTSMVEYCPDLGSDPSDDTTSNNLNELFSVGHSSLLIMVYYSQDCSGADFISLETLRGLKKRGVRVAAIWGDVQNPHQRAMMRRLRGLVDLNICTASYAAAKRLADKLPILYSWVPVQDEPIQPCDCGALLGYGGSPKTDRLKTLTFLERRGISIHTGGGEGPRVQNRQSYRTLLAHPLSLSFNRSGFESVSNARVFETLRQGSCLVDEASRETSRFLSPWFDFVPWKGNSDLLRILQRLRDNPESAKAIGTRGHRTSLRWRDELLWESVLIAIDSTVNSDRFKKVHGNSFFVTDESTLLSDFVGWALEQSTFERIITSGQMLRSNFRTLSHYYEQKIRLEQ